jgi:signal transduction histidine kinase
MSTLARLQERELRSWLYARTTPSPRDSFHAAIDKATDDVERLHRVPINAVVVGDAPLDDKLTAVVDACREAMVNAAKHARADTVSVYAEVAGDTVTCYVRDQGMGFDRKVVPDDRRGITDSIEGRMQRYGGRAEVVTAPGSGTEVRLTMPRNTDG